MMTRPEIVAVAIWAYAPNWDQARCQLNGARLAVGRDTEDFETYDFLYEIAARLARMEAYDVAA
jgi:hypothetical protein